LEEHIASIFRFEEYDEQETSVKAGGKKDPLNVRHYATVHNM
jgi:hypothetical protein